MTMRWAYPVLAGLLVSCTGADALVPESRVIGDAIPEPLSAQQGNYTVGQAIFSEREQGHCVLCHRVEGLDVPFQGDVGPDLSDLGARLTPGQIRLRIVDAIRLNPDTVMPSYYRVRGLNQVDPALQGKPVLTADQIEHLVAYLSVQGRVLRSEESRP